jgi:hypothetical protein
MKLSITSKCNWVETGVEPAAAIAGLHLRVQTAVED